jgi:hypothetical protein
VAIADNAKIVDEVYAVSREGLDPWSSIDVESWSPEEDQEPLGSKEKSWVRDASGARWLFKYARTGGDDKFVSGEDWAEIVASACGALLGIPIAKVRLGHCQSRRGTLSRSIVPNGWSLVHGNELLSRGNPNYVGGQSHENPLYTVAAVLDELRGMRPPLDWRGPTVMDGFDVWAGYLLFDAWVAGSDRHDENWGAVTDGSVLHLAPSFDHGNALGFQERPGSHSRMVEDVDRLETWARRGRCRYFATRPRLTELAGTALSLATPGAREFWKNRLAAVTATMIESALVRAPEALLSVSSRMFCERLLMFNRGRLLDDQ